MTNEEKENVVKKDKKGKVTRKEVAQLTTKPFVVLKDMNITYAKK